ncbi:MAG: PAS-domain containing protein [Magnetovibrio sp.]|nr:PAS-domain containing protein [Magnetovibrio sp.]
MDGDIKQLQHLKVLRSALDQLDQGVTIFDRDLNLVGWNRLFIELFDVPPELAKAGQSFADIIRFKALQGEYGDVIAVKSEPLPGGAGFVTTYTDISQSRQMILETKGLTKEFRGFVAVNDVNLKVRRGTIHALIGPNGAGKTTVFNLLTRFSSVTRGEIIFKGEDITHARADAIARKGIVRSFQISSVFPHLYQAALIMTYRDRFPKADGSEKIRR